MAPIYFKWLLIIFKFDFGFVLALFYFNAPTSGGQMNLIGMILHV